MYGGSSGAGYEGVGYGPGGGPEAYQLGPPPPPGLVAPPPTHLLGYPPEITPGHHHPADSPQSKRRR